MTETNNKKVFYFGWRARRSNVSFYTEVTVSFGRATLWSLFYASAFLTKSKFPTEPYENHSIQTIIHNSGTGPKSIFSGSSTILKIQINRTPAPKSITHIIYFVVLWHSIIWSTILGILIAFIYVYLSLYVVCQKLYHIQGQWA